MKILEIAPSYPPAEGYGIARYVEGMSRSLHQLGHEVHVLTLAKWEGTSPYQGVPVRSIGEPYPFYAYNDCLETVLGNLPLGERVVELWDQVGPFDVVMAHEWKSALAGVHAKRLFHIPLLAVLHGCQVGRMGGRGSREELYVADVEKWFSEHADQVLVESAFLRSELGRYYSIPSDKITVVPGGVVPEAFEARVDREDFRSMFAGSDEALVLFAGRLVPEKGPDLLIDAARDVLSNRPKTRIVIAGDGAMRGELENKAEELRISDRIHFAGYLGPVVLGALYQVSDLLAVTSRYESLGNVVLEALAHDLTVVAAHCEGLQELAKSLSSPRLQCVPAAGSRALATCILNVLAKGDSRDRDRSPRSDRLPLKYRWESGARTLESAFGALSAGVSR